MNPVVEIRNFDELKNKELYEILKLRNEVFIVEQECAYDDIDGNDIDAVHLFIRNEGEIVAYCRILNPGVTFPSYAIGRVVTSVNCRKNGYARLLMRTAIEYATGQLNAETIMVSAQVYLTGFYRSLGFHVESDIYLEDNIPHCDMKYIVTKPE